jgi:hypothetical protein
MAIHSTIITTDTRIEARVRFAAIASAPQLRKAAHVTGRASRP